MDRAATVAAIIQSEPGGTVAAIDAGGWVKDHLPPACRPRAPFHAIRREISEVF